MNTKGNLTAYKLWAPEGVIWSEWVKPILFADPPLGAPSRNGDNAWNKLSKKEFERMRTSNPNPASSSSSASAAASSSSSASAAASAASDIEYFEPPEPLQLPEPCRIIDLFNTAPAPSDTAIVADLPGVTGVDTAMALARAGFRPVPLYNGVSSMGNNVVPSEKIADALISRASELAAIDLDDDAPPVFMLDSNRMAGRFRPKPGEFDNRWRVFPQDMPSAAFLRGRGIEKVVLCSGNGYSEIDLRHILYRYQKQGLTIYLYNKNGALEEHHIRAPSSFASECYRYLTIFGLRRSAAGGFGGVVPDVTESSYSGG